MLRLMILALILAGCASAPSAFTRPADVYNPPAEYVNSYDALYAELFWRCMTPEHRMSIRGYAVSSLRNINGLVNFQVRLTARAAQGDILAESWAYGDRLNASQTDAVPFVIAVPAADGGARYDLYYQFVVPGEEGRGAHSGMDYFGMIEDVCGPGVRRKHASPMS